MHRQKQRDKYKLPKYKYTLFINEILFISVVHSRKKKLFTKNLINYHKKTDSIKRHKIL